MAISESYRKQVALLIRTIPFVASEKEFALKGGTAINLFVREMPRLSVDIDLTYVPIADRATSLNAIDAGMKRIADAITKGIRGMELNASQPKGETCTTKLILRADDAQIKIEVTPVLRGCVYEPNTREFPGSISRVSQPSTLKGSASAVEGTHIPALQRAAHVQHSRSCP